MSYNASGPVHIHNDGAYIRVTNDTNGVVINYVKASLIIQRDSSSTFFLKNDSILNYYNYTDVASPVSSSIDDLISQIKSWNTSMTSNASSSSSLSFDPNMIDPFSRLKVSKPQEVLLNLNTTFSSNAFYIDELSSNALSTYDTWRGVVSMNLISATGSKIIRQSKLYAPHMYGSTSTAIVNGVLTTNYTNSNIVSKIGVFDDANNIIGEGAQPVGNGIFFQYDNKSNLRLVQRTTVGGSQVDNFVSRGSWNIDTLDGNGSSGVTLNVNEPTNFLFEWNQANSAAIARAGVYRNGAVYCHVFSNAQWFGNPSLPIRWEIAHDSNLGSANSATMIQGNAVVMNDSGYQGSVNTVSYDLGSNLKTISVAGDVSLLNVRLAKAYGRTKAKINKVEFINISPGGVGKWRLLLNPSLVGQPSFGSVSTFVEVDTGATSATGGTCLASGFLYDTGVISIPLTDKNILLLSSISGVSDVLCLLVTNINGTLNMSASIEWSEYQ